MLAMRREGSSVVLYEDQRHKFVLLGFEEEEEEGVVQTNQYLIEDAGELVLLDPGGAHVFPKVLANIVEMFSTDAIRHIFYNHQDPDVCSGVTLWMSIAERAKIYISALWTRFLPHFGVFDRSRVVAIPDRGGQISLSSGVKLELLPAHFLHSTGAISLYDPVSKILFTGDIGAAVFPKGNRYPVVEDLDAHFKYMEAFHRRYMNSNRALRKWLDVVSRFEVSAVAPQHGAVIAGESNVRKFFNWLRDLQCGVDVIDHIYTGS